MSTSARAENNLLGNIASILIPPTVQFDLNSKELWSKVLGYSIVILRNFILHPQVNSIGEDRASSFDLANLKHSYHDQKIQTLLQRMVIKNLNFKDCH